MNSCYFCAKTQADVCSVCDRSICEDHKAVTWVGPKTRWEWYICEKCLDVARKGEKGVLEGFAAEDEQFWKEDQEEAKTQ